MTRPGTRVGRTLGGALVALALLAPACGPGGGDTEATAQTAEATTTSSTTTTTTTTLPPPPGGRRPTARDPLRVLMAGDSLMADISLAIASTLHDGGKARARLVAAPSVPRDDVMRALWRRQIDQYDPEVIILFIGVWEAMGINALSTEPLGSLAWERAYRRDLLKPYLRLLTSEGAEVVWVGMPPDLNASRQEIFAAMNRAVRGLARVSSELEYVPGDRILAGPGGTWTDVLPGPRGGSQRVRRIDTTHLCAEGAVRLARPVLRYLQRQWDVPLAENWPDRNWRWVFSPAECPGG